MKRKRNAGPGRNIPLGASREFVPVSELIQRAAGNADAYKSRLQVGIKFGAFSMDGAV